MRSSAIDRPTDIIPVDTAGTCSMLPRASGGVVDPELKVGIEAFTAILLR